MPIGPAPSPSSTSNVSQPAVGSSRVYYLSEPDSYGTPTPIGLEFSEFAPASFTLLSSSASLTLSGNPPIILRVDSSGGNRTVTLPPTASCSNNIWHISKTVSANTVTISLHTSDTWYGDTALQTLSAQWDSVTLISVNDLANSISGWHVIAST